MEASDESERSMMGFSLLIKILTKSKHIQNILRHGNRGMFPKCYAGPCSLTLHKKISSMIRFSSEILQQPKLPEPKPRLGQGKLLCSLPSPVPTSASRSRSVLDSLAHVVTSIIGTLRGVGGEWGRGLYFPKQSLLGP